MPARDENLSFLGIFSCHQYDYKQDDEYDNQHRDGAARVRVCTHVN